MESDTTVIIPFDDRVIFVGLLNCAEFSSRLSEVAQTLDAISGFNSWSVAAGSESGGFLARSESGVAPGCDRGGWGALRSLGTGLLVIWLMLIVSFREAWAAPFAATVHPQEQHRLGKKVGLVQTAQF